MKRAATLTKSGTSKSELTAEVLTWLLAPEAHLLLNRTLTEKNRYAMPCLY